MASLFFPDTTVLVHFALMGRMETLRLVVRDRGSWCASVAHECDLGARKPGQESMGLAREIFGEPLYLRDRKERIDALALRGTFAAPGDPKTKHLGEAETLTIINNRQINAMFVTDDEAAALRATLLGIPTYTTWDILKLCVRTGLLTTEEAWNGILVVRGNRGRRRPYLRDRQSFERWCES
ncbi:hypothetical protein [Rathayibacter soli]|uniref:hypothetical protein n=1 Tax=Rathayibacter soli TaxID=3144168 RepID=UPI0027E590CE|nr:hypothetical protein [Glaciibacter superstes]